MKTIRLISALTIGALVAIGGIAVAQQAGTVKSLRGVQVDEYVPLESNHKQDEKRFPRAYRQQPPLIPHSIEQHQIDRNANECLACHDWSVAGERGAPTLSMTHYLDRDGNQLDQVAGTRWFCNQCHVPQVDALPLVDNTFEPSK
ncbi:nitrate reductase cytochrome c-type subunit [Shimia abyssi]|uniref:Periplasmic nitrate reductase, electron transfer subunit n=1 Tax=Shimia abyssi TaxID=1662395 RepID=A0A2P8F972_9RHOB|nr:nitrate reductase cytochrome c-type subunit [Shimia abyssi]PSL18269.1 periplasmic nitrate reductase subunit NapB [Shimia abyssi]